MARLLFCYWDGGGSVPPLLTLIRGLVAAGHEVKVLGNASLRERVEAAGARFRAYQYGASHDPASPERDLFKDWEPRTPLGIFARVRDGLLCGPALTIATDTLEDLERERPDAVAIDLFLFGAMVAVERRNVPWAAISHTVYPLPAAGRPPFGMGLRPARSPLGRVRDGVLNAVSARIFDSGLPPLNDARRDLGLMPLSHTLEQVQRAPRTLVLSSPAFDFTVGLPPGVSYVGPPLESVTDAGWDSPWPPDHPDPLVLVSFSTTFQNHRKLVERAIAAFEGLSARAVVTLGGVFDPGGFRAPENVALRAWVPHAAVLRDARAVVTHGGHGTVMAALAAGVPVVCVPCGRDQGDNAIRVVASGAGIKLSRRADAEVLRRAVERALGDPALNAAAQRMADAIAGEDAVAATRRELEALAGV